MEYTLEHYVVGELIDKKQEILKLEDEIEKLKKEIEANNNFFKELVEQATIDTSTYFGKYVDFSYRINERETPGLFAYFNMKIFDREAKEKGGE